MAFGDEVDKNSKVLRSVLVWNQIWRTLYIVAVLFFLMHVLPDVELVIHKWAQRF